MALSERAKKIRRFYKVHAQARRCAKELDELKAYFKDASGGADMKFTYADIDVLVTTKNRAAYEVKASTYQEVSVRKAEPAAEAAAVAEGA